jgi:Acyl-CoA oxidase/Acyl-CoA dehydrogenase, N-terminal domain
MATTEPQATGVRAEDLQPLLDGRYASLRRQIRDILSQPEFASPLAIPTAEYRELVLTWMRTIAGEGLTAPGFPVEYGGHGDAGANIAGFETIAYGDLSLLVKFGVQFGLWGGAIHQLGTRAHHDRYLRPTATLAVDETEDGPLKDALGRLCDLYALYEIEQDRGYLQEHGRLTGPRCKAVTREVNRPCDEIRGDAEALVDAFGIPDEVLRAPIALR